MLDSLKSGFQLLMKHLWTIELRDRGFSKRQISYSKMIKGEEILMENSGLSKREWNELMEAFELKDKMI